MSFSFADLASSSSSSSCGHSHEGAFPCLPTNFVGWSSLAYLLLPLNICIYDLEQLYLFSCNCFKYYPPFSNVFQTGIYSFIIALLCVIHALSSFECHGCGAYYTCDVDITALYCIYFMLVTLSWTRFYSQYKIHKYYKSPSLTSRSAVHAVKNAKLIYTILFSARYHWLSTIIALLLAVNIAVFSRLYLSDLIQLCISCAIYTVSYLSFFFCEFMIRKVYMIEPVDMPSWSPQQGPAQAQQRRLRLSTTASNQPTFLTLGLFDVQTEDKKAIVSLLFIVIAGAGFIIDAFGMEQGCMGIAHGVYHIASALAVTFWYWSLVGETWSFTTPSIGGKYSPVKGADAHRTITLDRLDVQKKPKSPNSVGSTPEAAGQSITDISLRNHILNNMGSSSQCTYSNDIRDSVLNPDGVNVEMIVNERSTDFGAGRNSKVTQLGRKRSFLE